MHSNVKHYRRTLQFGARTKCLTFSGGFGLYSRALGARERPRTCYVRHVAALNGWINTLDYCVYIPTNKSEFSQSEYTRRLRDVITVINATMLKRYYLNKSTISYSNVCRM